MSVPAVPVGTREDVLADLRRRRDVAEGLMREAQTRGDDAGFSAAHERFFLRLLQIGYLEQRPEQAFCPTCALGETDWPPDFYKGKEIYACLTHWSPYLEREAAEQARIEREAAYGR